MSDRKKRADQERKTTGAFMPISYGREGTVSDKSAAGSMLRNDPIRGPKGGQASGGRAAELVPRAELEALRQVVERLVERVEDLEDALDAQAARAAAKPGDALPAELVDRLIAGESPVRIWREHRGLTLTALAERAELPAGYLSEIENRKKPGSVRAMRGLARALDLDLDDLVQDPKELRS